MGGDNLATKRTGQKKKTQRKPLDLFNIFILFQMFFIVSHCDVFRVPVCSYSVSTLPPPSPHPQDRGPSIVQSQIIQLITSSSLANNALTSTHCLLPPDLTDTYQKKSQSLQNGKVRRGTLQQRGKHPRLTIIIKYLLKIQFKTT